MTKQQKFEKYLSLKSQVNSAVKQFMKDRTVESKDMYIELRKQRIDAYIEYSEHDLNN